MHPDRTLQQVVEYHERTKHHFGRSARSLGYLDWETKPDPFRHYRGAPLIPLDEVPAGDEPSLDDAYQPLAADPKSRGRAFLSQLLYDSLALSAWKEWQGTRWSLRCNPSSGNLHPTEGYLLCMSGSGGDDAGGLYHYNPFLHVLEQRATFSTGLWRELVRGLPEGATLLGLSSIHWRESWKYGERAYRYCQLDLGHAIAAVSYAAAAQGWQARLLESVADVELGPLLGIADQSGPEREHPDCLMVLAPADASDLAEAAARWRLPAEVIEHLAQLEFVGRPNRLSKDHHRWPIIEEVSRACLKPKGVLVKPPAPRTPRAMPPSQVEPRRQSARRVFRQRRSALDMDGHTWLDRTSFFRMLSALVPELGRPPLSSLPWQPAIDLVFFVHRVRDLEPGLYAFARSSHEPCNLRTELRGDFAWEPADGCPTSIPLFLLAQGDTRSIAEDIACHQEIASQGVFAVSMVSEFQPRLEEHGPWFYRRLFWEAGAIGQVLYLEAEAAGLRATGIGCFFDDAMHELLGIDDGRRSYQVLYHLTVGGPLEDERLATKPPYFHRAEALARPGLATSKPRPQSLTEEG